MQAVEDQSEDIAFLQVQGQEGIARFVNDKEDDRPAKEKVLAFKSRVFQLLLLFVEKAKDLSPLLDNLTQEMFQREPQKIHELITRILNHGLTDAQKLIQIASFYKSFLLFKGRKQSQKYTDGLVRILRLLERENSAPLIQQMLQIFLTKRKCRLHIGFFHYTIKRIPHLKQALLQRLITIQLNQSLRPAQERILQKLKLTLQGKQMIKVQTQQQKQE